MIIREWALTEAYPQCLLTTTITNISFFIPSWFSRLTMAILMYPCARILQFIKTKKIPPFSVANGLDFGNLTRLPMDLTQLKKKADIKYAHLDIATEEEIAPLVQNIHITLVDGAILMTTTKP
jgi:hypothetical protein